MRQTITEAHLQKSDLANIFHAGNTPEPMSPGDKRAKMFLYKVNNYMSFETIHHEQVYISPESEGMKDIQALANGEQVQNIGKFIVSDSPETLKDSTESIKLSALQKDKDFGTSQETTGGSTKDVESLTALFCALRSKLDRKLDIDILIDSIRSVDLKGILYTDSNYEELLQKVDSMLLEIKHNEWLNTYIETANILAEEGWLVPGMEVHRESKFVQGIYNAFNKVNERYSNRNKWNPADIWLRVPGFNTAECFSLKELNVVLQQAANNRQLVGVSLKSLRRGKAHVTVFNDSDSTQKDNSHRISDKDIDTSEWLISGQTGNTLKIGKYKINFRCSKVYSDKATGWMSEIIPLGGNARGGKAGLPAVNFELQSVGQEKLPKASDLSEHMRQEDSNVTGAQISKRLSNMFYETYQKMSVENKLKVINGILDYAMSKTDDASFFIKVS